MSSTNETPGNPDIKDEKEGQISLVQKFQNYMKVIQNKTGVKGIYVVIALIVCVIMVYLNIFDTLITNLVGTAYPIFWTLKSIEEKSEKQKEWLTYWVVFGTFILVDLFSPIIIKFVPFYFVLKILFLIWLEMPGSNGCNIIYHLLVKKIFSSFEDDIDSYFDSVKNITDEIMFNDTNKKIYKGIKKGITKLFDKKGKNDQTKMEDALKAADEINKENMDKNNDNNKEITDKINDDNIEKIDEDTDKLNRDNIDKFLDEKNKKNNGKNKMKID